MKLGLFLCWIWFAIVVKAMEEEEEPENCTLGPFDFQHGQTWNTTDTGWARRSFFSNGFMSAGFQHNVDDEARYWLSSPTLCSNANATYSLSFKYTVGWALESICYLAVHVKSQGTTRFLWRSSGSDFPFMFRSLSPPLRFRPCSSSFQLIFEGRKTEEGYCGWFFNQVGFDDVAYSQIRHGSTRKTLCPALGPEPDPDDDKLPGGLSAWEVIAILVSLAVVIVILTALLILVVVGRRRRQKEQIVSMKPAASYQTFTDYTPQRQSMSDYESVDDGEKLLRTQNGSSSGHDPYNRLDIRGEVTQREEGAAHAHYDHFEGDRAYSGLNQQSRVRDIQRQLFADNYHHM